MIKELQNHELILQRQLQSLDKKYQFKVNKLKTDINEIENNTKDYEAKIRQREQVKPQFGVKINLIKGNNESREKSWRAQESLQKELHKPQ